MLGTKEIIKEAECLPVEERAILVDCLLRTLNSVESEIDRKWIEVAKQRLVDMRSGQVQGVSGEDVFVQVAERFA